MNKLKFKADREYKKYVCKENMGKNKDKKTKEEIRISVQKSRKERTQEMKIIDDKNNGFFKKFIRARVTSSNLLLSKNVRAQKVSF